MCIRDSIGAGGKEYVRKNEMDEGQSYGLYRGSGKAKGAMKDFLDKKAKKLEAEKKKQKPEYKNNPAFGDPSHHSNAKNRTEAKLHEFIKFTDAKKRRENLPKKDHTIWKPGFDAGLSKDVDITKDGPGKVVKQVTKDKVVTPIVNKGKEIAGGIADKATAGIKGAIDNAGKLIGSNVGKGLLGGAAILGTAALASKALSKKKEESKPKKQERLQPSGMREQVTFQQFQEKCWAGYEKKGMKTMFGKRYPNCVKKKK